ncbi:MAG TPA: adenylate/guanylate cyclase domain-containing protein [Candidatus Acidoferrum sp.]|nr:adenylate/guanylate cyclase domain-containing protein [Candidatus Acidoferrum sp.]
MNADPVATPFAALGNDPVALWLVREAHELPDARSVIGDLCQRLVATGFPLDRLFLSIRTLHPQVSTIGYRWRTGDSLPSETPREHGIDRQDVYLRSPIKAIHDGAPELRRRLVDPTTRDFPILDELAAEGATDYLIVPVRFSGQRVNAISIATNRPAGFSDAELARFRDLTALLALVLEAKETQRVAATLLDTYLGRDAGRRVLGGLVQRGDGITLVAALWYCDLRGFTTTTEPLPRDQIIALLNDYFACMVAPVHRHGGEVLKFIGDAMLAIFPIVDDLDRDRACVAALAAAEDALADLDALNGRRQAEGKAILEADIALHTGAVMYGNIGAPDRLDFTAIGTAVNLVTRLERMCEELGQRLLASARFASPCGSKLVSVGHYRLRGFSQPQEIFALPPPATEQRGAVRAAS